MALKRMFNREILSSARFLKMPISSQLLYFHLGLNADDDGIVNAYPIMKLIGVNDDDLKILVAKEFVIVLNEELITYLTDWLDHNNLRANKKSNSIYRDLLLKIVPDVKLLDKVPRNAKKEVGAANGQPKTLSIPIPKSKSLKDESKDLKEKDIKEVIRYMNSVFGTKYREDTEANNKHIRARLEKFTVDDLKYVIDTMYSQWKDDPKMSDYLRPQTLFNQSNFEDYLNRKPKVNPRIANISQELLDYYEGK